MSERARIGRHAGPWCEHTLPKHLWSGQLLPNIEAALVRFGTHAAPILWHDPCELRYVHRLSPAYAMPSPKADAHSEVQAYYDEFSERYERHRGKSDPGGYHSLVDDLEVDFATRYAAGSDVLEVGCGTGLILERLQVIARRAEGIDLSPGMLEKARARGLCVKQGSATQLPYDDATFDVTCSFKVLAHIEAIDRALAEMARVTRPGGVVIAEFYNPFSIRGAVKRLGPPGAISQHTNESAVFTRFDAPWRVKTLLPPGYRIIDSRGVRIVTPAAIAMRIPGVGRVLRAAEWALADSWMSIFGGFWIAAIARGG